jgi:hypothetical protein
VNTLNIGDRVRIDNPDTTDPDHDRYHGREGTIEQIRTDDAARLTEWDWLSDESFCAGVCVKRIQSGAELKRLYFRE